jgi:hypothetical protein
VSFYVYRAFFPLQERSLPVPAEYKAPEAEESEESKAPEEGATADGGSEEAKADKAKFHTDTPPLDDPECLEQLKEIRVPCPSSIYNYFVYRKHVGS